MAQALSFWHRVSSLFRSDTTIAGGNGSSKTAKLPEVAARTATAALDRAAEIRAVPWWQRRQVRHAQAREAAQCMIELAGALQEHFRQQDQRAAALAASLDRVGGILEQLAESQRSHGECLHNIAAQAETAGRQTAALTDTLGRLPDSLLSQADALRSVARQMDLAQESDTQLVHSLQRFGQAVDTLGTSGTAQVEVLQRLNTAQREQQASLTNLLREQSRRFLLVMMVATFLAVAALAAMGITLALHLTA